MRYETETLMWMIDARNWIEREYNPVSFICGWQGWKLEVL